LNPLYPSLKCLVQFFLIDSRQNRLHGSKNGSSSATWARSSFSFTVGKSISYWVPDQANRMAVAWGVCHVLRATLLMPDLCELSNCRDESQVVFDAAPFFEQRSLVRME
jgi:hypothetical protein